MKTIGLIGGMSWESTSEYYRIINEVVKAQCGGLHSAELLLYSVDFDPIEHYQSIGAWDQCADILSEIALKLEAAGADLIAICTNTMHKVAPQIQAKISCPLVHIADATAEVILDQNLTKVALLGTKYTMCEDFYTKNLEAQGLEVMIPQDDDIAFINTVIFDELCLGIRSQQSKARFLEIIQSLQDNGAQGIILGCTEIGLIISQEDTQLPVFDTTFIHATSIAQHAID